MPTAPSVGLRKWLERRAGELGLSLVGVASAAASEHLDFYQRWVAGGSHGEMRYLARPDAVQRRGDLRRTLAGVRSVVVVADEYFQGDPEAEPADPSCGVVARYARGRDYHKVLKKKLLRLLDDLRQECGADLEGRAYVDTGPLLERELARRAGLGWFGKNTMLINPGRGSWFFLGCLLLDVELEPSASFEADHCGSCNRCVEACPTGALLGRDEKGAPVMDARRCISYLTIEHKGPIPRALRPLIGNRIYGCDICQEVCPWNAPKFVQIASERDYRTEWRAAADRPQSPPDLPGTHSPSLLELMGMSREDWDQWTSGTAMRRAGYAPFRRNVAVGLGNWGSAEAVQVLVSALSDPEPLVRGHSAWALGRIGTPEAERGLRARLEGEADPWVMDELREALSAMSEAPRG